MKARCFIKTAKSYESYGGRGVTICDRWLDFWSFAMDVGERPEGCSLERIDNNGNYTPENVRWATAKEQHRNRRNSVFVLIDGVRYSAADLSDRHGLSVRAIKQRSAKGLPFESVVGGRRQPRGDALKGGAANAARLAARTHCAHGHEINDVNSYRDKKGQFVCRPCRALKMRKRRARLITGHPPI